MPRKTLTDRFWEKVQKTSECWFWIGATSKGYGKFYLNGKTVRANRVSWELHFGPIPDGQGVLHTCDNPSCIRPDHLFLGTQKDNVTDMKNKGRAVNKSNLPSRQDGEHNGHAKLTAQDILVIREMSAQNMTGVEIARKFSINPRRISEIINRKTWTRVH